MVGRSGGWHEWRASKRQCRSLAPVTSTTSEAWICLESGGYSRLRPCRQLLGVRDGREPAEPFRRPLVVVLMPPGLDYHLRMGQAREPRVIAKRLKHARHGQPPNRN